MIVSKTGAAMFARWGLGAAGIVGIALAAVVTGGCDQPPATESEAGGGTANPDQGTQGSLSVAVAVPPNLQIDTVSYQLTKASFSLAGSLNVAQSGTIAGVIGGIPAGSGYTLALSTTDIAKTFTSCAGSSTVDVTGGATTPVGVTIECRLPSAVTTPPAVPVPRSAVALLAVALLMAGVTATRRSGRRGRR